MKIVYIISRKIYNAESYYTGYGWSDLKNLAHEYIDTKTGSGISAAMEDLDKILKDKKESAFYYEIQTCYRR